MPEESPGPKKPSDGGEDTGRDGDMNGDEDAPRKIPPRAPGTERRRDPVERLNQFKRALEVMQVGVTIADLERKIIYSNPAEVEMHGYSAEELVGQDVGVLAPQGLLRPLAPEQLQAVRSWRRESLNLRKDGSVFPVEILSDVVTDADGVPVGIVSITQDITDRKKAEAALRDSEERYALATKGANDGLWDCRLDNNATYFSPRWKAMFGYEEHEIGGNLRDWFNIVHPEDLPHLRKDIDRHLTGKTELFENEHRIRHRDGTYKWTLARGIAVRDESGKPTRMAGSLTDLTTRKIHDPLTGLPNPVIFTDRVRHALARAARRRASFAVICLDLDCFKMVNDSLGHMAGDQLLIQVANRLTRCLRRDDTVASIGGDEFAILLEDLGERQAVTEVVERLRGEFSQPFNLTDQDIFSSASIGVAFYSDHYHAAEEIVRDAVTAMHAAKSEGRGRYQFFDHELRKNVVSRLKLETELNLGLKREEFILHYQPIVSVDAGHITGMEALLRWDHPERGLISAREFIAVAEDTGLLQTLDRWSLFEACRQLREWQSERVVAESLTVSINVSPNQIRPSVLPRVVEEVLLQTHLPARCLLLEFAEPSLREESESVGDMLRELRAIGTRLCIDDFGTGYSALQYLSSWPIDVLKVDRSFFRTGADDRGTGEVLKRIIQLARDLGIVVVAEGVETQEELLRLKRLGCRSAQGFWFSRPVGARQARSLLLMRRSLGRLKEDDEG